MKTGLFARMLAVVAYVPLSWRYKRRATVIPPAPTTSARTVIAEMMAMIVPVDVPPLLSRQVIDIRYGRVTV